MLWESRRSMSPVNPRTLFEASFQLTFLSVIPLPGLPFLPASHNLSHAKRAEKYRLAGIRFLRPPRAAEFRVELHLVLKSRQNCWPPYGESAGNSNHSNCISCRRTTLVDDGYPTRACLTDGRAFPSCHHPVLTCQRAGIRLRPHRCLAQVGRCCFVPVPRARASPAAIARYALDALRDDPHRWPLQDLAHMCAHSDVSGLNRRGPDVRIALLLARRRVWGGIGVAGLLASAIWIAVRGQSRRAPGGSK